MPIETTQASTTTEASISEIRVNTKKQSKTTPQQSALKRIMQTTTTIERLPTNLWDSITSRWRTLPKLSGNSQRQASITMEEGYSIKQ